MVPLDNTQVENGVGRKSKNQSFEQFNERDYFEQGEVALPASIHELSAQLGCDCEQ